MKNGEGEKVWALVGVWEEAVTFHGVFTKWPKAVEARVRVNRLRRGHQLLPMTVDPREPMTVRALQGD